jgi:hypothetical protein
MEKPEDKCIQKIFNKKLEEVIEKDFKENKKRMRLIIKSMPNTPLSRYFKTRLKRMIKQEKTEKKKLYKEILCNPTCKDTLFESGDPNKLTPSFIKKMLKEPKMGIVLKDKVRIKYRIEERQKLFEKNKTVLEDGFYKGLDKKTRKKLRARGSISGCYKDNLQNFNLMNPILQE